MKTLDQALQNQYKQELKMLKELTFFLELEEIAYHIGTYGKVQIWAQSETYGEDLEFRIETHNRNSYILHVNFFDTYEMIPLGKIQRVQAKTIVNNIKRIINALPDLLKNKQQEREMWKRQREQGVERYKEKIRQEVIAELQKEAKSKEPAKKRTRKSVKKTENTERFIGTTETPLDIQKDTMPDF
ncbi:TPA: hypothetical protein QCX69_000811 [Bacillus anthracis]|nr:hypothetical protein [Bacillus anthracis]